MARARHKHVLRTHKSIRRRRTIRFGVPATAAALALASPAAGVVWPDEPQLVRKAPVIRSAALSIRPSPVPMRVAPVPRTRATVSFVEKGPEVNRHMFATAALDLRRRPSAAAPVVHVIERAERVAVTGKRDGDWAEIVLSKTSYWVTAADLADKRPGPEPTATPTPTPMPSGKPSPTSQPTSPATPAPTPSAPAATGGLSTSPCPMGSAVESGLVQNTINVHRAVCAAFPQVKTYGGVRTGDGGDHSTGHALDITVPDASTGDQIAAFVRSHAGQLHVNYVIWSQHIWSVARSSEGWRLMEDRGSTAANHYDHVHVSVN